MGICGVRFITACDYGMRHKFTHAANAASPNVIRSAAFGGAKRLAATMNRSILAKNPFYLLTTMEHMMLRFSDMAHQFQQGFVIHIKQGNDTDAGHWLSESNRQLEYAADSVFQSREGVPFREFNRKWGAVV